MEWRHTTSGIIATALGLVLVAGCSGLPGVGGEPDPAPTPGRTSSTTEPPPPPPTPETMSVEEYGAALDKAMKPVESSLNQLAGARKYKGLEKKVTGAGTAASDAVLALEPLNPPAELAAEHSQLIVALFDFSEDLTGLSSKVGDQSVCTGATTRAKLGNSNGTSDLRTALAPVLAKLPAASRPALKLPAADQKPASRPSNGTFLRGGNKQGRAEFLIENNGSTDALISLSRDRRTITTVYVRGGKSYTVKGVSDGTYTVFYTSGGGWDRAARGFGVDCSFDRFADTFPFKTTRTATQILWKNWTITLKTIGGNARTDKVDPDDFPDS